MNRLGILVTGMHRSGTSWVGNVLGQRTGFIIKDEEIFNPSRFQTSSPIAHSYVSIGLENEEKYIKFIDSIVANDDCFDLWYTLRNSRSLRDPARFLKVKARSWFRRNILKSRQLLLIEPTGLTSAEWLIQRYGLQAVVLVRHPAAVADSLKRLGWDYNFAGLLYKDQLTQKYFASAADEIRIAAEEGDVITRIALLWRLLYSRLMKESDNHPEWIVVRQEDLARRPVEEFRKLYNSLGLNFSDRTENFILSHTSSVNESNSPVNIKDDNRRNAMATVNNWKTRLTTEEIERVRLTVGSVADHWYSEDDWVLRD